jgi:hypothetical protein
LLAHGADPSVIGKELYSTFEGPDKSAQNYFPKSGNQEWCKIAMWERLRAALNITQKYLLNKAAKLPAPSPRRKQVATALQYEPLFQVPFNLVGQDLAVQEFTTAVLTHRLLGGRKPLIVIFAGELWCLFWMYPADSTRAEWTWKDRTCKANGISSVVTALYH